MVDELTRQSFMTGKAVVEVATELIKLLAVVIDKQAVDIENSISRNKFEKEAAKQTENMKMDKTFTVGGDDKDADIAKESNSDIADAFEDKLKEQGLKYERLSDNCFIVAAKNKNEVNKAVQETAKGISKEKRQEQKSIGDVMEKKLQKAGISYERVNHNQFKYAEKDGEKLGNIAKDAGKEIKEKKTKKKETVKDKIKRNKQRAVQRTNSRQKDISKQKSQNKVKSR